MISKDPDQENKSTCWSVQIMVGKSVATMGYLDREDTRRYHRSDSQASIFSKRQDMTEPDSLQAASGTNGSLNSDE